ncbi:MAG: alpha/beta hydrolase [Alphaproteobacteria bacterium]|nr:alpha/beta hydrolase [Alphaproteobacteria bacterium]
MRLHPQVQAVCDEVNAQEAKPLWDRPIAEVRADFNALVTSLEAPGPKVGKVANRKIPGPHGKIPIRIYWPKGYARKKALPVVINFHGSGYVVLGLDTHDNACRAMCEGADCMVVGVDYRKAPENKFPKPTDDAWASTKWVAKNCAKLGGDPNRIAVAGDSAGGCLATVVAQRAKKEGGPKLVFQLLVYPVTDTREDRPSYKTFGEGYLLTAEVMNWFFDCYFNKKSERSTVTAAPIRARNLSGLPPALVMTASHDPLYDEGVAYAKALKKAGVPTQHINYQGHIHGFWTATGKFDVAAEAHAAACKALRKAFRKR